MVARQRQKKLVAVVQVAEQLSKAVTVATERNLAVVEHAQTPQTAETAECTVVEPEAVCMATAETVAHTAAVEDQVRTVQAMRIMAVQGECQQVFQAHRI